MIATRRAPVAPAALCDLLLSEIGVLRGEALAAVNADRLARRGPLRRWLTEHAPIVEHDLVIRHALDSLVAAGLLARRGERYWLARSHPPGREWGGADG